MLAEKDIPLREYSPQSSVKSSEAPLEFNSGHSVVDWMQLEEEHFTVNNPLAKIYAADSPISNH